MLQHEGIVSVYDVGWTEDQMYIVMEYIEGGTVQDWIRRQREEKRDDADYYREVAAIVERIARALHYAHSQGVIHRDIKPGNILLDNNGRPHISDFGLATTLDRADVQLTLTGEFFGTPLYMSPEQAERGSVDHRSDIYSLGLILFEMLTMDRPFRGESIREVMNAKMRGLERPRRVRASIPKELERICMRATKTDPDDRYESAGQLADDLQRFLPGPTSFWRKILRT